MSQRAARALSCIVPSPSLRSGLLSSPQPRGSLLTALAWKQAERKGLGGCPGVGVGVRGNPVQGASKGGWPPGARPTPAVSCPEDTRSCVRSRVCTFS